MPTTLWATNATISAAILAGPVVGMLTGAAVIAGHASLEGIRQLRFRPQRHPGHRVGGRPGGRHGRADGPACARRVEARGPAVGRRRANVNAWPGRYMTASSRCWRWWPNVGVKSAVPQRNWRTLPANRNARCGGWSLRRHARRARRGDGRRRGRPDRARPVTVWSVSVPGHPGTAGRRDRRRTRRRRRQHPRQRARPRRTRRDGLHPARGPRRHGHGQRPRRRRRIAPGRLEQAAADGRLGISNSIVGRLHALAGTARLSTEPGAGTEWELTVPETERAPVADRQHTDGDGGRRPPDLARRRGPRPRRRRVRPRRHRRRGRRRAAPGRRRTDPTWC